MHWRHYPAEQPKRSGYYLVILIQGNIRWPDVKIWMSKKWEMKGEDEQANVVKWCEIPPWN